MKDIRHLLIRHHYASAALAIGAVTFMEAPFLSSLRAALAQSVGMPIAVLWIPLTLLVIGGSVFIAKRSIRHIALPLKELAKTVEHGQFGFAFQKRSRTKEEDALKHYIESQGLRSKESEAKIEELEGELDSAEDRITLYMSKKTERDAQIEELEKQVRAARLECDSLKSSKLALEVTLENERKSKVGAEVQKRSEEIYAQMERAVSAAAQHSIWTPSLVQELKTPISLINDLSTRLRDSWSETSLSRIGREIDQICRQSETQLELLGRILVREPGPPEVKAVHTEPPALADGPCMHPDRRPVQLARDETRSAAPKAGRSLMDILRPLAEEFGAARSEIKVELLVEQGLYAEINDESLEPLLRCLLEILSRRQANGEISLRVSQGEDHLAFDLQCNGEPRLGTLPDLARAERLARALRSQVEVEMPSDRELRLSFRYRLANAIESIGALDV